MSTNCCCGGSGTTTVCENTIAELPRYYPRQLITPDDLTLEQEYFRDRLRRHNRLLHGWGVVCGALVCPATKTNSDGTTSLVPYTVIVQTGYILGPYGDEIILDCLRTVDVRTSGVSGMTGEPCIDAPDPWCTQVYTAPSGSSNTVYIAVQYKQTMMRPVRVQPAGCGCADTTCEYSRWHDGYEIGVLSQCPTPIKPVAVSQAFGGASTQLSVPGLGRPPVTVTPETTPSGSLTPGVIIPVRTPAMNPACPDCPPTPWVGLAVVTFDSSGNILTIDNCACRRIVYSFSQSYRTCSGLPPTVNGPTSQQSLAVGAANAPMTVTGSNFLCGATAAFDGTELTVTQTQVQDSQTLNLSISVSANAPVGVPISRNLTVTNMDGSTNNPPFPIQFMFLAPPAPPGPAKKTPAKPAAGS